MEYREKAEALCYNESKRRENMDWITGMQNAIDYIEEHITEELDYETIAQKSASSSFHFQRIFSILCGYTLGEYIRNRRLSLAAEELSAGKGKIIDIATQYGYDSPDSFARAFQKFHGMTPSQARGDGVMLKSFSRLHLKISLEGGTMMNYKIEQKPEMLLLGYKRRYEGTPHGETRIKQEEMYVTTRAHQWILQGMSSSKGTHYVVLANPDLDGYDFCIAYAIDQWTRDNLYNQQVTGIDFMDRFGFEEFRIPACTYAVFETQKQRHPIEEYSELLQKIYTEWLPSSDYRLADAPEIAVYHWGTISRDPNRTIEIWIPIEEKK